MGWRDRYVQGSFRGIPFQIEIGEDERSQRMVVHEFPGRDKPYIEKLGKKATPFTIEAYLVGDDYLEQRDLLQDAFTATGPGKLVHPFYGELTVEAKTIKTRHVKSDMRMVYISMEFIEVGDLLPVKAIVDTQKKVEISARQVITNQKTTFERAFDYASLPYNQAQTVLNVINTAIEDIAKARALVAQAPAFAQMLRNIGGAASTLVLNVTELADELINLITFGFLLEDQDADETPDTIQSFKDMSVLFEYNPTLEASSAAADTVTQLVRAVSLAQGGHLLALSEFASSSDAKELKTTLYAGVDSLQTEDGLDDQVFISTQDLVAQVERDLADRLVNLPKVMEMTLPEFMPAMVLSYQLYGNIDQETGILERNKILDPGLVPSDIPIKVLTNG